MKKMRIDAVQLLFLLKVAIGSAISIWIAGSIGLLYSPSAGIITLLTIQNTKRETLSIAVRRLLSFLLSVLISYLVFTLMGYTFAAFGLFLLFFVGLCSIFGWKDGISMNAVLMTHFLIERHMKPALILNEILLLFIGMGIGILINMIMPKYKERIRREQTQVEEEMKRIIRSLAVTLRNKDACLIQQFGQEATEQEQAGNNMRQENINKERTESKSTEQEVTAPESADQDSTEQESTAPESTDQKSTDQESPAALLAHLDEMLEGLLVKAYEDAWNTLLSNTKYLLAYLEMRKLQVEVLKGMAEHIGAIPVILRQSLPMADFMEHMASSFHELNNVVGLLAELEELNLYYRKEALPVTREEFEYRAILFQVLKDLEYFLLLKRNFVEELEKKNIKGYWS